MKQSDLFNKAEVNGQIEDDSRDRHKQQTLFDIEEWWEKHWQGMPEYNMKDLSPFKSIRVNFANQEDMALFSKLIEQTVTTQTQSVWYPQARIDRYSDKRYVDKKKIPLMPRFPIYIPTKGRWEQPWTILGFQNIGVPFKAVVEEQEFDYYAKVVDPKDILILPFRDKGLVATRNWIWDHARDSGARKFWTFDDNIGENLKLQGVISLYRLNNNLKTPVATPTALRVVEDFVDRYENVPIAGMNYFMFASRKTKPPPFYLNTRVYSNMLIETNVCDPSGRPYRNEGFYNDDTDLCLRVLKDGFCTVLLNAFLIYKRTTMTQKGGLTEYYQKDGRYKFAKELYDKHPDVVKITRKWGRWHHYVDYSDFKKFNKLKPKAEAKITKGTNNYGIKLIKL